MKTAIGALPGIKESSVPFNIELRPGRAFDGSAEQRVLRLSVHATFAAVLACAAVAA